MILPASRQFDIRAHSSLLFFLGPFFTQETEFNDVGNSILSRLDEMGKRMDDLDSSISDLMNQAGLDGSDPSSPSSSPKGGSPTNATKNSNSAVL